MLARIDDPEELKMVLRDLLTPAEIDAIGERWVIVNMLVGGHTQRAVRDKTGASLATVNRGSRQLKYGHQGFMHALDQLVALGFDDPREGELA